MTAIPPNWLGSIIQSQGAQERATQAKNAEEAKGTERGAFSEKLQDIIENTDRDVEVYSDAEGAGSQGKPFGETEEEEDEQDESTEDQDVAGGVDIEA